METNNRLETLEGEEYQLSVGEGTYQLRDSIALGQPSLPHSEQQPPPPPNPLDTRIQAPMVGTRLSIILFGPKNGMTMAPKQIRPDSPISTGDNSSQTGSQQDQQDSRSSNSISMFRGPDWGAEMLSGQKTQILGHDNPALAQTNGKDTKDSRKAKKPKNNLVKTNSSFIQRVLPADNLTKRLNDRNAEGLLVFANVNRAFQWLDLAASEKSQKADPLTKILFAKAHALCHDVNQRTSNSSHIDFIMGFSTGDIIWYDPISQKYSRINKNGTINPNPVYDIKWIPGSPNLFIAAHSDGTLVVYDKEKEDQAFVAEHADVPDIDYNKPQLQIFKSIQSQNQKFNPVAFWRIAKQRINSFSFSPDAKVIAAGTEGGRLYLVDPHEEKITDLFLPLFGGIQAICWSPDGRYILSGGQDDLVHLYSFDEKELVARFQGHRGWVNCIAFDPWRCDGRNYRFGSVADDRRLLLWDFNASMLQRPRAVSIRQRTSVSSNIDLRTHSESVNARLASNAELADRLHSNIEVGPDVGVHIAKGWNAAPKVPAIMDLQVDNHELSWIGFHQQGIITSCGKGHIRTWDRPQEHHSNV
ncbi:WD40 repeat-like protein [Microthyrium microscopicum]|uniref:WD40 repeat-like protein n=1 Tax=Microthyrium microscopicum TaxID=703497 RepID=A0A6A6UFC6_9PEZI|nr:WD40 repeat-like protein [Microthyrium microscopicum]